MPIVSRMVRVSDILIENRSREEIGDLEWLVESIKEKGVIQPITITPDNKLLAGERRYRAAVLAGLEEIPAVVRTTSDELDATEIELYENLGRKDFTWLEHCKIVQKIDQLYKEKNLDWSGRKTAKLLDVSAMSVSRNLQLASAVDAMPALAECKTQDEAWKKLKAVEEHLVVQELRERQQVQMNKGLKNTLKVASSNYIIADTFEELKDLKTNGQVHFIECDPPYAVDIITKKENLSVGETKDTHAAQSYGEYEEIPIEKCPAFLENLCKELYRVAAHDAWMVFWHASENSNLVLLKLREAGWHVDSIPGIWSKGVGQTLHPDTLLARTYEPFYICRKGQPILTNRGRANVFTYSPVPGTQKYHPTQRPLPLITELLETFSHVGQVVLIPFLGSGATLRACYLNGNLGFGWELSTAYKDRFLLAVEEDLKHLDEED